jgi:uncharacterized protein DUF6252
MKKLLLPIVIFLVIISCQKKVDELPPATQTGANTFGAKVNGNMWMPAEAPFPGAAKLEASYFPSGVRISARNLASSPTETEFEFFINNVDAPGTYPLNTTTQVYPNQTASYGYYVLRTFTPKNEWVTSSTIGGAVNITKNDTVNHIISGTFQFDAVNMYGNPDTLHATEGRFDIKITF